MTAEAIGIDLGTTFSCVGVFRNGRVEIISNDDGYRITPSCVAFTEEQRLIGKPAKDQLAGNPENTLYEVKRLIGRRFEDPGLNRVLEYLPFKVIKDEHGGEPVMEVRHKGEKKEFSPEVISGMILEYMKETAKHRLSGANITKAVVTIPAYFKQAQRRATFDAAKLADFDDCIIINEPTAAVFAYKLARKTQEKNVLVYDLGGGTFDVSIVKITKEAITVKAIDGNSQLGGLDFDKKLMQYALEYIKKNYDNMDLSEDPKALARIKTASEIAKKNLSNRTLTNITFTYGGTEYEIQITRASFEQKCSDLFDETMEIVKRCLDDAKMDKYDIDDVLLIGGSTRIPRIKEILQEYFGEKKLNKSINPEEAVAHGAAQYAAMTYGEATQKLDKIVLYDVIPLSLGIELKGGIMSTLIKRNTSIPQKNSGNYCATRDDQTVISIEVYEGERELTKYNSYLYDFSIDIPPLPIEENTIVVTFEVNTGGILDVTAKEKKTGNQKRVTITEKLGRLSHEDVLKKVEAAQLYREEDAAQKAKINARNDLESYALKMKSRVDRRNISEKDKEKIVSSCDKALEWLANNQNADKDTFFSQLTKLKLSCDS